MKFVIYATGPQWYWRLESNGRPLAVSTKNYKTRKGAHGAASRIVKSLREAIGNPIWFAE